PLFVFVAVFTVTTRTLLQRHQQPPPPQDPPPAERSANVDQDSSTRAKPVSNPARKENREEQAPQASQTVVTDPAPAVATVTVTIDAESGLLARQDCRLRSRMTYPSGSEPTGYCNLVHTPPPKESRIKSLAT